MAEHTLDRSLIHHDWDNSYEPVLSIASGDVVHLDLLMAGHGQVHEDSAIEDVVWDFDTIYNLAGPIHVEGARAGDTLEVEILSLTPGRVGLDIRDPRASGCCPTTSRTRTSRSGTCATARSTSLAPNVRVPFRKFLGTMGVALDEPGRSRRSRRTGRRQHGQPAPRRGHDAVAADLVRRRAASRAATRTRRRATARSASARSSATRTRACG